MKRPQGCCHAMLRREVAEGQVDETQSVKPHWKMLRQPRRPPKARAEE